MITNYLAAKKTYKDKNINDFINKIASTNNTKVSLLQKITRYFGEKDSLQNEFINLIDERIFIEEYFKKISDIRNHIAHGRINKQLCTDILELMVYYVILSDIGVGKEKLTRLGGYIDFNRIKNNL